MLLPAMVIGVPLVILFPFTRYGNERMDWKTPDEVAGVRTMYQVVPRGSVLTSVNGGLPWQSMHYADYQYRLLDDGDPVVSDPEIGPAGAIDMANPNSALVIEQIKSRMVAAPGQRSYLVLSRSQDAELDLTGPYPQGTHIRLRAVLDASRQFVTVYRNDAVTVMELIGGKR
jgi:hypothetical protein